MENKIILLLSLLTLAYARNIIEKNDLNPLSGSINQKPVNDINGESTKLGFKSFTDIALDANVEAITEAGDLSTDDNIYKDVTENYVTNIDAGSTEEEVQFTTDGEFDINQYLILFNTPAQAPVYVAFDGDRCPKGMVKFQNLCLYPD